MLDYKEYEEASLKFQEQDKTQFAQQQREYTQKDQDASADKAWNYVVETTIFEKEYEALGIEVSDGEFDSYLYGRDGFTVMPELQQGFTDSITGLFNAKLLEKELGKWNLPMMLKFKNNGKTARNIIQIKENKKSILHY